MHQRPLFTRQCGASETRNTSVVKQERSSRGLGRVSALSAERSLNELVPNGGFSPKRSSAKKPIQSALDVEPPPRCICRGGVFWGGRSVVVTKRGWWGSPPNRSDNAHQIYRSQFHTLARSYGLLLAGHIAPWR